MIVIALSSPQLIGLLIGGLLVLAALLILPRRIARRSRLLPPQGNVRESERKMEDSLQELVVRLHEVGRDVHAKVDTKMASLNVLVEEADQKIEAIRKVLDKMDKTPLEPIPSLPITPSPDAATPAKPAVASDDPEQKREQVFRMSDSGDDVVAIARQTGINRGEVELMLLLRNK